MPSCNVSWEAWLEGCVEITGDAVRGLLAFYTRSWDRTFDYLERLDLHESQDDRLFALPSSVSPGVSSAELPSHGEPAVTILLPSPHHRNPIFRPLPWQEPRRPR